MLAEFFALLGGFLFSLVVILVRRNLGESNFVSATVIVTLVGTFVYWIISSLFFPLYNLNPTGIMFFALAGLFTGVARLNIFKGMEMLGASTNASIFATYPLFGSLFAVLMLSERPSTGILVGMVCIICGVVLIERSVHGSPLKSASPARMIFPLSAATSLGFAYVLRKMGLNAYNEPLVGIAITYLSSLCFLLFLAALSKTARSSISVNKRNLKLFLKPGLVMCVAQISTYYALIYGDVSTVTPLMNVEPFFVLMLAYLFLKELEKITYKLVLGTLIIVTGVTLITIF